jgi:predicted ribosomally synthesized peptide with nif11-like leader
MSIENAKAFYQRMTKDLEFRTPFESASTQEELQQLIQDSGYDFTTDEWQAAVAEIQTAVSDEELQDAQLAAISGGKATPLYGSPSYDNDKDG